MGNRRDGYTKTNHQGLTIALKISAVICCWFICYQDFKERAVYWFMFPALAIVLGAIHFMKIETYSFFIGISVNFIITSLIVLVLYLYARFITKKQFLNHSLGLGDILFFYALGAGFPSYTFILLFAMSIFFSLVVYMSLKNERFSETIPLAGLMSLFVSFVICFSILSDTPSLYSV